MGKKSQLRKQEQEEMHRRHFFKKIMIATAIAGVGYTGYHYLSRTTTTPIEQLLREHATFELINPQGKGNFYLIAQEHYYAPMGVKGREKNAPQAELLPQIQTDIFFTLKNLSERASLKLVIGEGFKKGEIKLRLKDEFALKDYKEQLKDTNSTQQFFREHPKETGYAVLEAHYPDLVASYGINDLPLQNEIDNLERKLFNIALVQVLTKQDYNDSQKRTQVNNEATPHKDRILELNNERSRMYLTESAQIADSLGEKDLAVVIGAAHIPLMRKEYKGARKLYIVKPNSLKRESFQE